MSIYLLSLVIAYTFLTMDLLKITKKDQLGATEVLFIRLFIEFVNMPHAAFLASVDVSVSSFSSSLWRRSLFVVEFLFAFLVVVMEFFLFSRKGLQGDFKLVLGCFKS